MQTPERKPNRKLGLALGGGGARGLVHIGVLKVLEREGIPIACLAGTSMGGIIAAAYAGGMSAAEIEENVLHISKSRELIKLIDPSGLRRGLLEGRRVRVYLSHLLGEDKTFADLRLPLALNAVDLTTAKEVVFTEGPLLPVVLASCAVPGLFPPQSIEGYRLIDGGVLNNVPVSLVRHLGAGVILAVDPSLDPSQTPPWQDLPEKPRWPVSLPEFFLDFYRAGLMMVSEITHKRMQADQPDIYLCPPMAPDITMFLGFPRAAEIIAAGEEAACQVVPELKQLLE